MGAESNRKHAGKTSVDVDGYYARLPGHRLAYLPLCQAGKRRKAERDIQAGEQKERRREIEIALRAMRREIEVSWQTFVD